ncbi:hypothetical protein [Streptomyces griseofuscus]|uniref:hypothetical protein n=1 Tax=Streptomyces griseofuscus TaxID=146922 RepID=UPI00369ECC3C
MAPPEDGHRSEARCRAPKKLLDAPEAGMVWAPGEEAWESKFAALRSYRRSWGTSHRVRTRCGARARR